MIKALGTLVLILLAIGVGFSLYLPPYSANIDILATPTPRFTIIDDSLTTPFPADALRYSQSLLAIESDDKTPASYGLQLGIFGSLKNAAFDAEKISDKLSTLLITPAIFKVENQQRQWFVLALGPLESKNELTRYQRLLNDRYISSTHIVWPGTTKTK